MRYDIQVNEDDITYGQPRLCRACPVSLALCRILPLKDGWHWSTDEDGICARSNNFNARAEYTVKLLDRSVSSFVRRFDKHACGDPFSFSFEADLTEYLL